MAAEWQLLRKFPPFLVDFPHNFLLFDFDAKSYIYVTTSPTYNHQLAGIWKYDCAANQWKCMILYTHKNFQKHKPDPHSAFFDYKSKLLYLYNLPGYPRAGTLLCVDILSKKIMRKVYLPKRLYGGNYTNNGNYSGNHSGNYNNYNVQFDTNNGQINEQFETKYAKFICPEILIENNRLHAVYMNSTRGPLHMIWHNIFNGNNYISSANNVNSVKIRLQVIEMKHTVGRIHLGHCLFYHQVKKAPIMFTNDAIYIFKKNTGGIAAINGLLNQVADGVVSGESKINVVNRVSGESGGVNGVSKTNVVNSSINTQNDDNNNNNNNNTNNNDINWCKLQSIYGNKVLSSSVIFTDCSRYIITFGAVTPTFKQLIFVYDIKKHITLPSALLCPGIVNKNDPVQFSAVYMHCFAQDACIINGYINNCYLDNSFQSLQYIPAALTALLCKFYMFEFVHLISNSIHPLNGAEHYKINLDAVFDNLYYYYEK